MRTNEFSGQKIIAKTLTNSVFELFRAHYRLGSHYRRGRLQDDKIIKTTVILIFPWTLTLLTLTRIKHTRGVQSFRKLFVTPADLKRTCIFDSEILCWPVRTLRISFGNVRLPASCFSHQCNKTWKNIVSVVSCDKGPTVKYVRKFYRLQIRGVCWRWRSRGLLIIYYKPGIEISDFSNDWFRFKAALKRIYVFIRLTADLHSDGFISHSVRDNKQGRCRFDSEVRFSFLFFCLFLMRGP